MIQDHIWRKHATHDVRIDQNPLSKKGLPVPHPASLRCVTCGDRWLKWLSGRELIALGMITQEEWNEYRADRQPGMRLADLPVVQFGDAQ